MTRSAKALAEECTRQRGATAVDRVVLTDAMEDFDKRWEALEAAQTDVELSLEADGLEADIEVASEFRLRHRGVRVEAIRLLAEAMSPQRGDGLGGAASVASSVSMPSLPNLELPKYSFWDQFEAIVDKSDLPEVSKFTYLQSLLRGKPKLPSRVSP